MQLWKFDNAAEERLKSLLAIVSPSTAEMLMAEYLRKQWLTLCKDVFTDVLGNVYSSLVGDKLIHVGLIAHMDTVAIQITQILPNGMLLFRSLGLSPYVLLAQKVYILTHTGCVAGVVGFDPTSQYSQPKGLLVEDLWIDIGTHSGNETELLVCVGDLAVFQQHYSRCDKSCISATGIDDRIGLFIITECLRWFSAHGVPLCLHVIGSVQEEIGLRGASVIANHQHLDACFVVDVDYATDTLTPHENQLGRLSLGNGVGIHRKADNNVVLQRILLEVAAKCSISYQTGLGRFIYGGTDATPLQLQMGGIATANVNIPCRYIHSPIEICDVSDVEDAVNLLIAVISRIAELNKKSFIPGVD